MRGFFAQKFRDRPRKKRHGKNRADRKTGKKNPALFRLTRQAAKQKSSSRKKRHATKVRYTAKRNSAPNKAQAVSKPRRDKKQQNPQANKARRVLKKSLRDAKKGKTAERKPDSVVLANRHSFICAGGLLRPRASLRSATYPMCYGRAAPHPTLSCTELGLQCPSGLLRRRWSLTPPFHPYRLRGGIFSVALSMRRRFPPPPRPFKRSSALWCPDFPLG